MLTGVAGRRKTGQDVAQRDILRERETAGAVDVGLIDLMPHRASLIADSTSGRPRDHYGLLATVDLARIDATRAASLYALRGKGTRPAKDRTRWASTAT
ncbi:hypothetical protein ETD86_50365 [Nonomuraea turkmeniaca]|uniref:Uncharacterized protein n=1 Tax=Nonomuraea turkmeniaca TaxID=103838 RepID=A0A5S4EW37_9ACTN|nr:hypothetical protein [Nonomuraea turkmeniaca]TMR07824.1 hypothetical protein ETD86_50365 [Nonomuraea turkmeniaca]